MIVLLSIASLAFGMLVSGGVLTILVSVGLITRFADKTNTADHITKYENAVILGTLFGCIWMIISRWQTVNPALEMFADSTGIWTFTGTLFLLLYGFFAGIFEGCFAIAVADMLNSIPIFARRINLTKGIKAFVVAMALGKCAGSLFYFFVLFG